MKAIEYSNYFTKSLPNYFQEVCIENGCVLSNPHIASSLRHKLHGVKENKMPFQTSGFYPLAMCVKCTHDEVLRVKSFFLLLGNFLKLCSPSFLCPDYTAK